jgi:hypothetical protein
VSPENDTIDPFFRVKLISPEEAGLRGDLQRLHDELRELLSCFCERRMMGDRDIRIARVYEERVYKLYDLLREVRERNALEDRS